MKLLIWGASGHAKVVADIVRRAGTFEIVGYLDDLHPHPPDATFLGAPLYTSVKAVAALRSRGVNHLILGIGNCEARLRLAPVARKQGFFLATAVHPCAVVAEDVRMGAGTVVMAGAVINPGTVLGENVIVNTGALVDHDCIVEDGVHICPGTRLAGDVTVERGAWVGIGATVIEKVRIGAGALVGAGAVVIRDVPENARVAGVPARVLKGGAGK
ncbi:MAG: acyltransferase, left-handed parallel beta-helix (hexapeptide repeat) family [Deltaproteobacteria bacterium]|nr:acyltransferase, left-handed parallel beta-helix (hexapeptide repeat) family [Deltaproteobacteria bacterium]